MDPNAPRPNRPSEAFARMTTAEIKRRIETLGRRSSTHGFRSSGAISREALQDELARRLRAAADRRAGSEPASGPAEDGLR